MDPVAFCRVIPVFLCLFFGFILLFLERERRVLRFSVLLESAGSNKARRSVLGGEGCWLLSIIASLPPPDE